MPLKTDRVPKLTTNEGINPMANTTPFANPSNVPNRVPTTSADKPKSNLFIAVTTTAGPYRRGASW